MSPFFSALTEQDPCASQPCKNGGTCSQEGELYKCNCTSDYEGEDCELVKCKLIFSYQ